MAKKAQPVSVNVPILGKEGCWMAVCPVCKHAETYSSKKRLRVRMKAHGHACNLIINI